MSKVSRELTLLRLALAQSQGGAGTTLKLVEFVQKDGDSIAVNPDHVASVEQRNATSSTIMMQDGSKHTVEVAFADVLSALQE